MIIDKISTNLIQIALYLDKQIPGIVSEIWIDEELVKKIKKTDLNQKQVEQLIQETKELSQPLTDSQRKHYYEAMLDSLEFQIKHIDQKVSYDTFSKNSFGYQIDRVTESEIKAIENKISSLEKEIGLTRAEVFTKHKLDKNDYQSVFQKFVASAKHKLPDFISDFPDEGFEFETVTNKPWSAFNSHIAPFRSRLTINTDVGFSKIDLNRLSFHEAYGGHHSELSHKDKLLINEHKGEHGLVITFSPQTFVSEAIAEGIFVLLGGLDKNDKEEELGWLYDRLTFALQNMATYMFFDDNASPSEIRKKLNTYAISDKTAENIISFSTDPLFGKYAPVYYSAFNFISDLYKTTNKKDELIRTLFTEPCTPSILVEKYK